MDLLELPVVMIENILSYLNYDEIAKYRVVSKQLNVICMRMLNRGFLLIERRHAIALKTVKAQLPRRESERRYHPLARHCDILSSIETRISMLNMTYSKFIDTGICCFIPGKVIDEIRRVLALLAGSAGSAAPPRAHEVLQELRDISSMAIEHFDDKISPAFRRRLHAGVAAASSHVSPRVDGVSPLALKQELFHLRRRAALSARLSVCLARQYRAFYRRMLFYRKIAAGQRRTIKRMSQRQNEQDAAIADLKKRIEECDIRYTELTHTNQAAGGKAIAAAPGAPAAPLRHFGSQIKLDICRPIGAPRKVLPNIKPRKPVIRMPSLTEDTTPESATAAQPDPPPSTSQNASKSTSTVGALARIRGIAAEIRALARSDSASTSTKVKRSLSLSELDDNFASKKMKGG